MELYLNYSLWKGTEEELLAIKSFENKKWRLNGLLHRIDGPAVITSDGYQEWYQNGLCHREDGPAIIYPNVVKIWAYKGKGIPDEYIYDFFPLELYYLNKKAFE